MIHKRKAADPHIFEGGTSKCLVFSNQNGHQSIFCQSINRLNASAEVNIHICSSVKDYHLTQI